jgi:hypothetical protein
MTDDLAELLPRRVRLDDEFAARQQRLATRIAETSDLASRTTAGIEDALATLFEGCRGPKAVRLSAASTTAVAGMRDTASRAVTRLTDEQALGRAAHAIEQQRLDELIDAAQPKRAQPKRVER